MQKMHRIQREDAPVPVITDKVTGCRQPPDVSYASCTIFATLAASAYML